MKRLLIASLICLTTVLFAGSWTDPETGITWQYEESDGKARLFYKPFSSYPSEPVISTTTTGPLIIPSKINNLPVGVIGENAFKGCEGLTAITIPSSVTSIERSAFFGCHNVKIVYIEDLVAWCKIGFVDENSNPLHSGAALYLNNECVTELKIPPSIGRINSNAFYGCTSLQTLTLTENITTVGEHAFSKCINLRTVSLEEGITTIGSFAFDGCTSLISLTIPESVKWIGAAVSRNLQEVIFKGIQPKLYINTTYGYPSFLNLKVVKYLKYPGIWQDRQIEYKHSSDSIKPLDPTIPWIYTGRLIKTFASFNGGNIATSKKTCVAGDSVTVTATPKEGYLFLGWSCDAEGIGGLEPTISFTMPEVEEVVLIANFFPKALLTSWINETIDTTLEAKVVSTVNAKIDGEKLLTAEQATAKTTTTINQKVEEGELITSDQLQVMALSEPVIKVKDGTATVGISVIKASAVDGEWENVELEEDATSVEADTVKVTVPADEKAAFYKFVVPEKQATE